MNVLHRILVMLISGLLASSMGISPAPATAQTRELVKATTSHTAQNTAHNPTQSSVESTVPSNAAVAWDAETGNARRPWECNPGNVCFWTGRNGTGSRCMWNVADSNWTAGKVKCSWARKYNVNSVWNRGTNPKLTGVAYFSSINYINRRGCTKQGRYGNLPGTYKLLSHKWITGFCAPWRQPAAPVADGGPLPREREAEHTVPTAAHGELTAMTEPNGIAACSPSRSVRLYWDNSRDLAWARGSVRNCGTYDRACVILWWGTAVPYYGFRWTPVRSACHNIRVGNWASFPTPTSTCYMGYYQAQLKTWDNRTSGSPSSPGSSSKFTALYDLGGCR